MKENNTVDETCDILCVGKTKLYQLINSGEIKAKKLGKRTIISKDEITAFLSGLESFPVKK